LQLLVLLARALPAWLRGQLQVRPQVPEEAQLVAQVGVQAPL